MLNANQDIRPGDVAVDVKPLDAASLRFIGRIRTPWKEREECPRQGRQGGPECRIEVFEPWVLALNGLGEFGTLEILLA